MNSTRVARKLRARIGRFSGDLSKGLCKAAQRFVGEMVYGIQASESVMLTEIGRTLEEDICLRKTQWRLSRNLQRRELEGTVGNNVLSMAANHIDNDTLLIIDLSDLSKKYAKKMEFLARVRDGSTGELADGYWTLHVIGAELDSSKMVPLYQRLWSTEALGHVSENAEILNAIDAVMAHVGHRGLWVMDRGGDRINLFAPMLERGARFLFRLVGNRHLLHNGKLVLAEQLAGSCRCRHIKHITRIQPVFLRKDERIAAHVTLCMITYLLERWAEIRSGTSFRHIRQQLRTLHATELIQGDQRLWKPNRLTPAQQALLKKLDIPPPKPVLHAGRLPRLPTESM